MNEIQFDDPNSRIIVLNKKLQDKFFYLKTLLKFGIGISIFDFIIIFIIPKIFLCFFNILLIIIIIINCFYCLYIFKNNNYETIDNKIYNKVKKVIIIELTCLAIYYIDMLYILVVKIFLNFDNLLDIFELEFFKVIISVLSFIFYIIINVLYPILIVIKLTEIKRNINNITKIKEQKYDKLSTNENV